MYSTHTIEIERRERNRDLMREAARDRLLNEALAGRHGGRHLNTSARPGAWLLAHGAAAAALLIALLSQPALPNGR